MENPDDPFRLTDDEAAANDPTFGDAAIDYERYRARYPPELFERLAVFDVGGAGQRVLDLGTGTGFLARELGRRGCEVVGLDTDRALLEVARRSGDDATVDPEYVRDAAERVPFWRDSFDVVTAGQCWHWFDRDRVRPAVERVARADGRLVVTHFDWLPEEGNVVAATERLIREWNPAWPGASGDGRYPEWTRGLVGAGFQDVETFSFEVVVPYSHAAWRGRVRASAGVGGELSDEAVAAFDRELGALLESSFPAEPLEVPHRSYTVVCRVP